MRETDNTEAILRYFHNHFEKAAAFRPPRQCFVLSVIALIFALAAQAISAEIKTIRLEPAANMTRAEIDYIATVPSPKAVLVLCPGDNDKGGTIIQSAAWQDFAKKNRLGLAGLSFASSREALRANVGYYHAALGSGGLLEDGLRKIYGKNLPVLLYGFSGGAHFVSNFENWQPHKVLAWCAYSAGWWDRPQKNSFSSPGLVACGVEDKRLGPSLIYFKQGRALGKPWLWASLPRTGHEASEPLDEFVRRYFESALEVSFSEPQWVDIYTKTAASEREAQANPVCTGLLPSARLIPFWKTLHEP